MKRQEAKLLGNWDLRTVTTFAAMYRKNIKSSSLSRKLTKSSEMWESTSTRLQLWESNLFWTRKDQKQARRSSERSWKLMCLGASIARTTLPSIWRTYRFRTMKEDLLSTSQASRPNMDQQDWQPTQRVKQLLKECWCLSPESLVTTRSEQSMSLLGASGHQSTMISLKLLETRSQVLRWRQLGKGWVLRSLRSVDHWELLHQWIYLIDWRWTRCSSGLPQDLIHSYKSSQELNF